MPILQSLIIHGMNTPLRIRARAFNSQLGPVFILFNTTVCARFNNLASNGPCGNHEVKSNPLSLCTNTSGRSYLINASKQVEKKARRRSPSNKRSDKKRMAEKVLLCFVLDNNLALILIGFSR